MRCRWTISPSSNRIPVWGVVAIVLAILIPNQRVYAQAKATAEVEGAASDKNRHPVTYLWDGETDPTTEQVPPTDPSHYYTFFYTGTVSSDGTVPIGTVIRRIPIPFEEWELNKSEIILNLATFYDEVYATGTDPEERKSLVNQNVRLDGNFNYVDTTPPEEETAGAVDPLVAAEWAFYYDQLALWSFYCKRIVLDDPFATEGVRSLSEIEHRESVEAVRALKEREDIDMESVDSLQLLKKVERDRLLAQGHTAEEIDEAEAFGTTLSFGSVFDPWADWNDPHRGEMFRGDFQVLAEERETYVMDLMNEMLGNISLREVERDRYAKWREDGRENLRSFVEAWTKVQSGERVTFEEVFYLISEEPIESVPAGARNVVRRTQITPQDLIDSSGQLKGAQFDQGE